ncbi:MAG: hypothetical protein ACJAYE_000132 [Candidatus Azotimanducaceae bacterium]|jgi:hypothetical protein
MYKKPRIKTLFVLIFLSFLAACSDSGDSASVGVTSTPPPASVPAPGNPVSFGSNAVKGPLENATVTLTDANGVVLESFVSDTGSTFSLSISDTAAFPVIVSTVGGIDSFTTQDVSDLSLTLKGVVFRVDQSRVNINPISTLMVEIALATNELDEARMNEVFFSWQTYNFGLPEGFNPISSLQTGSNTPAVLMAYESLFEAIRRTSNQQTILPNEVIEAIAADLSDGILDGVGTVNVDPIVSAIFGNFAGLVLLESLAGQLVIDSGGATEKTLASADIQAATLTLSGDENLTAEAALPPSERVLGLVANVLAISAASTTDAAIASSLSANANVIAGISRSNKTSAGTTATLLAVLQAVRVDITATAQAIDSSAATSANTRSQEVFAVAAEDAIPRPVSDFFSATSGQLVALNVLANDPDVIDGLGTISILQEPDHGTTVINADNTISYQADIDYLGLDSFVYAVVDQDGDRGAASVTITVNVVPVAVADAIGVTGSDTVSVAVLANDQLLIDGPIVLSILTSAVNGTATVDGENIAYVANDTFAGIDSFEYQITDASGDTASATVTVTVAAVVTNSNPVVIAVDDNFNVQAQVATELNVLANDIQLDDVPLTLTAVSPNAEIGITSNILSYTSNTGFGGSDEFTYTVTDASGDSSTATVAVFVDTQPIAAAQTFSLEAGESTSVDLLLGASGLGNPPITASILANPESGTIRIAGSTLTYTAAVDLAVIEVFSYTLTDADGDRGEGSITASITLNTIPQAVPDSAETPVQTAITVDVLANDNGLIDAPISLTALDPTNGSVTVGDSGITYTPASGFAGTEVIAYTIADVDGEQSSSTLTILVDDTPVAQDDSVQALISTLLAINVLENDTGLGNSPVTVSISQGVSNGTAVVLNNVIQYTPTTDFAGSDSLTYVVQDLDGDTATATVSILVDDTPILQNQSLTTPLNVPIDVNILANALGLANTPLTMAITAGPTNGTAVLVGSTVTYTPNTNFAATDTITYTVTDSDDDVGTATASIFVNDVPVANQDALETPINVALGGISFLANDTGLLNTPLSVVTSSVVGGTVTLSDLNVATFTPTNNFTSNASFIYQVTDSNGDVASATVSIFVDDTPVANADSVDTPVSTAVAVSVLDNDTGLGNAPLVVVTANDFGGVSTVANNVVTFTPTANFANSASFTYTVTDSDNDVANSTGTVFVDDTPIANNDALVDTLVGTTQSAINVLSNDSGLGNVPITVTTSSPVGGALTLNSDNTLEYAPTAGFAGAGSFSYTVVDMDGDTATASATIFVDDRPVAVADAVGTPIGDPLEIDVTTNDTGLLNGAASIQFVSAPDGTLGSATIDSLVVTYTPTSSVAATDQFTYTVTDTDGDVSAAATVTVGIGFSASDDTVTVVENISDATRILGAATRTIDVLTNDAQGPGGAAITGVGDFSTSGTVAFTASAITYTPPVGAAPGTDSFTYTINNAALGQDSTATVSVTIGTVCDLTNVRCLDTGLEGFSDIQARIKDTLDAAQPGDWVKLRAGVYDHPLTGNNSLKTFLSVGNSGTSGNPIRIEAFDGEDVLFKGWRTTANGWNDCTAIDNTDTANVLLTPSDCGDSPAVNNELLILVGGDYVELRNVRITDSTNFGLEVIGSNNVLQNIEVSSSWFDNIKVGLRTPSGAISNNLFKEIESRNARHGAGINFSAPQQNGGVFDFAHSNRFEDLLLHRNGYQPDGLLVPVTAGDSAAPNGLGGGNSDGFVVFKVCEDSKAFLVPLELNGVVRNTLCPDNELIRAMAFNNADDGIDTTWGESLNQDNISFSNGPQGFRGYKVLRQTVVGLKYVGNIALGEQDTGFEVRADTSGLFAHNLGAQITGGRMNGGGIITQNITTASDYPFYNNLFINNANIDVSFSQVSGLKPDIQTSFVTASNLDAALLFGDPMVTNPSFDATSVNTTFPSGSTIKEKVDFIINQFKTAYTPLDGSPLIDAGQVIPGVHCTTADDSGSPPAADATCRRWLGANPDIGPFELK